jgi:hypothetical protein
MPKGGESISSKQKDRTTTNFKKLVFQFVFKEVFQIGILFLIQFQIGISNLENASQNRIHLPLTICKKTLRRIF